MSPLRTLLDGRNVPQELLELGVTKLLPLLLYVLAAVILVRLGRRMLHRFQTRMQAQDTKAGRSLHRSATLADVMGSLLTGIVWTLAVLQILTDVFGLKIAPIITGAGIIGIALGFGAQSLVRDFLTGFFVLLEDQYRVGDWVEIQGVSGTVERFTLRSTSIRSPDGTLHHIANGLIERSANQAAGWSRALVDISVDHGQPMEKVRLALLEAGRELEADPDVGTLVLEPPTIWGVENFTDTQMTVRVAIKTSPGKMLDVGRVYRQRAKEVFERVGVEISTPTVLIQRGDAIAQSPAGTNGDGDRSVSRGAPGSTEAGGSDGSNRP